MKKRLLLLVSGLLIVGLTFGMSYIQKASATVPGINYLASTDASGAWANGSSQVGLHAISGDGRYVVFVSNASNLVSGDTNGKNDVFVKDTQTGTVTLVDVDTSGTEATNGAYAPAISYDGRYVVFVSSNNLVTGVTGANVYRRDLTTGTTTVVSQDATGAAIVGSYPDINADGRYVVFDTRLPNGSGYANGIVIKDMTTGAYQTVALGRWDTLYPSIDCDGHVVTYLSYDDLGVAPAGRNQVYNYYNYIYSNVDWSTNPRTYIASDSTISGFQMPPQISCDGNMITIMGSKKYNRLTQTSSNFFATDNSGHIARIASISDDGRYIAFLSKGTNLDSAHASTGRDSNYDLFVADTRNGTTQLVSSTLSGYMSGRIPALVFDGSNAISISPDGSTIAYSYASPDTSHTSWELISGADTNTTDIYTSKTGF